jgi:hypothetical protein
MKNMQKVTIKLAGGFACAGVLSLVGFFINPDSQDSFLLGSVVSATISVSFLLLSTFCVNPTSVLFTSQTRHQLVEVTTKSKGKH